MGVGFRVQGISVLGLGYLVRQGFRSCRDCALPLSQRLYPEWFLVRRSLCLRIRAPGPLRTGNLNSSGLIRVTVYGLGLRQSSGFRRVGHLA